MEWKASVLIRDQTVNQSYPARSSTGFELPRVPVGSSPVLFSSEILEAQRLFEHLGKVEGGMEETKTATVVSKVGGCITLTLTLTLTLDPGPDR